MDLFESTQTGDIFRTWALSWGACLVHVRGNFSRSLKDFILLYFFIGFFANSGLADVPLNRARMFALDRNVDGMMRLR